MSWSEPEQRAPEVSRLRPPARSTVLGAAAIGAAAGLVGLAVSAGLLVLSEESTYAPLVGAVAIAVWLAGGFGGAICVLVGWGLADVVLAQPRGEPGFANRDELIRYLASLAVGLFVALVGLALRRGQDRAVDAVVEAEHSRGRVQRLQDLTAALSAALTPEDVARVLVESVPPAIGARGGALGLIEGDELVIVDPSDAPGQTLEPGARLAITTKAPITTAARLGQPMWVERRKQFVERFPDGAELAPYASGALAVPVFSGSRIAGAMGFPFAEPDAVTREVRTLAMIAADLGGQALERAELYAQERASAEGLDRILAVAPRFQLDAVPDEIARSICVEALRTFGSDAAQVWTPIDEERFVVTWRDPPSAKLPAGTQVDFADFPGLLGEMTALRSMFVPDAQEAGIFGVALNHARDLGIHSSLRLPIAIGGRFERILTLQWERIIDEPSPAVIALGRRFADQAGLAIEQAERRRAQEETRLLQGVTEALAAAATPAEVAEAIVRHGVAALGGRGAIVYAKQRGDDVLELVASAGYAADALESRRTIPLDGDTPVAHAVHERNVIVCETYDQIVARYPSWERREESLVAAPLIAADRAIGAVFIGSESERQYGPAEIGLMLGVARQAAQSLDRARLLERELASAARTERLQRVTAALSKAVTIEEVTRTFLEQGAAAIGATAGVVALGGSGSDTLEIVGSLGYGRRDLEPWPSIPSSASAAAPLANAARTGKAIWALDAEARSVAPLGEIVEHDAERAWIALPLGGGHPSSGSILFTFRDVPVLVPEDRDWLLALAGQCAQALDRAGRYETERAIAETLQRSVLPDRMPSIDGIAIAARYLPGTGGVDVGGDWYDAMLVEDHLVGLVVGDVVGKGVRAAATMGQLRNALRAFAFEYSDPAEAVGRLNRLVDGLADAPFATLAYVVVDPRARRARYVVAGHPPPLVRNPDGATAFAEGGRSLPLGVDADVTFSSGEVSFDPGSTLVLYTDGLVERRDRPLDVGLEQLRSVVERCDGDAEELVDAVLAEMFASEERGDDVALVALRLENVPLENLQLALPSDADGLVQMRTALRDWLTRAGTPAAEAEEIVLAVWEAGANAIEHAQKPSERIFRLDGSVAPAGQLRLEVRDTGGWKQSNGDVDRGLGLTLMRSLMDNVRVTTSDVGTAVVLERQLGSSNEV